MISKENGHILPVYELSEHLRLVYKMSVVGCSSLQ